MTDSQFIGSTNMRISMLEQQMKAVIEDLKEMKYAINNHSEYIKAIIDVVTGKTQSEESEEINTEEENKTDVEEMFEDMPEELQEEAIEDYLGD